MDQNEKSLRQHEENLQRVRGLRLLDDDFMTIVFDGDIEATELLLNIILDRNDMVVTEVVGQREIKNANGRSVRLDILAKDDTGKNYDIEIQRADRGASTKRARFNSSMLDTKLLDPGQSYAELPEAYVIFITENDVMGSGLPMYHVNRWIEETNMSFGDGSHIIYVNGAYNNETDDIGKLMHDFRCTNASDMNFSVLADRVRYFKETEGGQEVMCRTMEEMCDKAAHERAIEIALKMLKDGMDTQAVANYSMLSLEEVNELAQKKSA